MANKAIHNMQELPTVLKSMNLSFFLIDQDHGRPLIVQA